MKEITKPLAVKRDAKINSLDIQDIMDCLFNEWGFTSETIEIGDFIFDKKRNTTFFNVSRPLFFN